MVDKNLKLLTDLNKFKRLSFCTLFKGERGSSFHAFPCLKQNSILLNQPLAGGKNYLSTLLFFTALFLAALFSFFPDEAFPNRGIVAVSIMDPKGKQVVLYKGSYALVIGISDYTGGWPKLPGVKSDVKAVKEILDKIGFNVVVVENPNQRELEDAFKDFVLEYGLDPENRLLFYYAGHGHTHKPSYATNDPEEWMGYLVSRNAPQAKNNLANFFKNSLSMRTIENVALSIESKHAIFIFDSCFSGTVFGLSRSIPEDIQERAAKPVRQFITSGTADQVVPDISIFRRQFISALEGEADRNHDGYVTGSELGLFLEETVTNLSRRTQTPRYGKVLNRFLNKGDFVFNLYQGSSPPASEEKSIDQKIANRFALLMDLEQKPISHEKKIEAWLGFVGDFPINNSKLDSALAKITELRKEQERLAEEKRLAEEAAQREEQERLAEKKRLAEEEARIKEQERLAEEKRLAEEAAQREEQERLAEQKRLAEEEARIKEQERLAEEKRLTSEKSEGMEVTRLESGIPKVSPQKLTGHEGMVFIPAGKYVSENSDSPKMKQLHAFYMDANEVTQKDYAQVMGKNPSRFKGEDLPVEMVTWEEAKEYCRRVGKRLPTSEEWEKAARAATSSKYYWGNTLGKNNANCNDCGSQWDGLKTAPVRSFPPNAWGLYDMAGNVWEWVDGSYDKKFKVLRGGSWMDESSFIHSTAFYFVLPENRSNDIGFRCSKKEGSSMISKKNIFRKHGTLKKEEDPIAEEKSFKSNKPEGLEVARLEPGLPKVSPEKLTEHEGMALIPAGTYVYGEPGSQEMRALDAFYMDVQEVTQKDYEQLMGKNPSGFEGENRPVERVTWEEAKEYCHRTGKRLPTSEEWEKTARAGTASIYYWGNTLGKNNANCNDCGSQWDGLKTAPVRTFPPNAWGFYDMAGNVWEWVDETYDGKFNVLRGGSWMDNSSFMSPAESYFVLPGNRSGDIGFRCAKGITVSQ